MNNFAPVLPKARTEKLIIKELPDETLVYDLETDKAHCLNQTAALIWKSCDGNQGVDEIGESVERQLGLKVNPDVVWLALSQLEKFRLLEQSTPRPAHLAGLSRRQAIGALGLAAAAIPLITSIVVPVAVQAQSCGSPTNRPDDCACTASSQCATGCCRSTAGNTCKPGVGNCI